MHSAPEPKAFGLVLAALIAGAVVGAIATFALRSEVDEPKASLHDRADAFMALLLLAVALLIVEVLMNAV